MPKIFEFEFLGQLPDQAKKKYSLSSIPEVLEMFNKTFVLAGVTVIIHPVIQDDVPHYICATKVNNSWEFYDDKDKGSPYTKSSREKVSIHTLMYAIAK